MKQAQLTFFGSAGATYGQTPGMIAELDSEAALAELAVSLGARGVAGWSPEEEALLGGHSVISDHVVECVQREVLAGRDPLGNLFCRLRTPNLRRAQGAVYTPPAIVRMMVESAAHVTVPARVIDPGAGSARFLLEAGRKFPFASLVGIELDPLAALMARANLATCGMASRATIILGDYRAQTIPSVAGRTLYIGNPPYVRHHLIETRWKQWLTQTAASYGFSASQLAGLHVHFFLSTVEKATHGDYGVFITAAEWLDVNYGRLLRDLFTGPLGGRSLTVVEPAALPFPDAATTAVITSFEIGCTPPAVSVRRVENVDGLTPRGNVHQIRRERLEAEGRWSHLTRTRRKHPDGYVELGELCRVHRGQVTGHNRVWIAGSHSVGLPDSVLYRSVTRAAELIRAGRVLDFDIPLRSVIDIPADLSELDPADRAQVERFLRLARSMGADSGYVATYRKAWWSVGLRHPAPILATYMARRPPVFSRNIADARHLNIAHGLYPREPLSESVLAALVEHLSTNIDLCDGRTYAGGLTKFEPREMERILVPTVKVLEQAAQ